MKFCLLFSLLLIAPVLAGKILIPRGATWKYLADGSDQGSQWRSLGFDDSAWSTGAAPLGYGDAKTIKTNIGFGPNSTKKHITSYLRHSFTVENPSQVFGMRVDLRRDDGAVVYLNGREVRRSGMPKGKILYNTFSKTTASGAAELAYHRHNVPPKFLVAGKNVIAVEVHQSTRKSSDVAFDLGLSIDAGLVTRGPYLQQASSTGIIIRWRTSSPNIGVVRYGKTPDALTREAREQKAGTEHELSLTGLSAASRYYYSVGDAMVTLAGASPDYQFTTSPLAGAAAQDSPAARIWVLGDSGTADNKQSGVRDAFWKFSGERFPDLMLFLGDNAYNTGTQAEYQAAMFNTYPKALRRVPAWSTLGNHETGQATEFDGKYPYFDIFTLPTAGEAGGEPSGTEHYYSFDHGPVHFICLDSMTADRSPDGAMATWLKADLASTTATWIVAFWHHPPYTKGSHDSDVEVPLVEMRKYMVPILEAGGVDLVLSGHSHCYERSFLIDRHYGDSSSLKPSMKKDGGSGRPGESGAYRKPLSESPGHHGAIYTVAGSAGKTSGGSLNHPAMFISLNELGSMVLDIKGKRLDATFVNPVGKPLGSEFKILDSFSILKENTAPVKQGK